MVAEEKENDVSNILLAHCVGESLASSVWIIDSGCSNHMTGEGSLFNELDKSQKHKVRLGDDKEITVKGKGSVAIIAGEG